MTVPDAARHVGRHARRAGVIALGILAAGVVMSVSVDVAKLAPTLTFGRVDLRRIVETYASRELKKAVRIGGLSVRLFDGRFVATDLVIDGLTPADVPFLKAREVAVNVPLFSLLRRRVDITGVELTDWQLDIETWGGGRSNLPTWPSRTRTGPSLVDTSVAYVRARRGQFTYVDHGTPWSAVVRNLDITVLKLAGYRGYSTSSGGTVAIQAYTPMTADLRTWFAIEGNTVRFERIELDTDGAKSTMTGLVDVARWPEQTYLIQSVIQLAPQRAIWWAPSHFTLSGEGTFEGQYHLFKGGHVLSGAFRSEDAGLDWYRFPQIEGNVVWSAERLDVTGVHSKFYGGGLQFTYSMAPLNQPAPSTATWDATYDGVDLSAFTDAMEMKGLRLAGRASGHNLLQWRTGHWEEHHGHGDITAVPPAGVTLQGRTLSGTLPEPSIAHVYGDLFPPLGRVPIGGGFSYEYGPEWVDAAPGYVASPSTYLEFQGRTAYGDRSRVPFHVTSSDWQQSDRELAGVITAFGSPTRATELGGAGTFDGVLLNAFWFPRVEGLLRATHMRAFDVDWGNGDSRLVIENLYADVKDGVAKKGESTIRATGRFALGYPRKDHGEEINAVIQADNWDLADFRHAFLLDPYPYEGRVFGELHLWGRYLEPFGFGRGTLSPLSAYEETATSATASLRFDGPGVWLDAIDIRKGATGTVRGSAHVEWLGSYAFNVDAHDISVESIDMMAFPQAPLTGRLDFTAFGSGQFLRPSYDADFKLRDLYVKDEGIGDVKGRLGLRGDDAIFEFAADSPSRVTASGAGKVTLLGNYPGDVTLRLTDTSLDPFARVFMPGLSPFASAVASGTVRVSGTLASLDNIVVKANVDRLAVKLFDYGLHNDGVLDAGLEQGVLRIGRFKLAGENTSLGLSGNVDVVQGVLGLRAEGAVNLGILQAFTPDIRGSGRAEVTADFTGTMEKPQIGGSAVIANGRLRHMWLPHSIDNLNGRVVFAGNSIRFDDVTATIGNGPARFGGRIGLQALWPAQFEINFAGEGMELRYPAGFRSVIDADLSLRGTLEDPQLSGSVLVRRSEMRRPLDLGSGLAGFAGSSGAGGTGVAGGAGAAGAAAPAPAVNFPLRFDVRLSAPSTLEIDNKLARLTASADLRLRGTYQKPILEGRAEVERGEVWFEGKRYVVSRGTVDFPNPSKIEPYFDVEAETRVRAPGQTYRVTLSFTGTTTRFDYALSSDPPLPEVDILSLLLGDAGSTQDAELRTLKTPNAAEQSLIVSRSARLLASPITTNVQKVVEQTFGLDSVQITPFFIDPSLQTGRFSPGARLTIGKRVSDRIYLTYSRSLASASRDQVILLEYDQSDRLAWIVTQNEDRTYALDVRVRHVFK